jgi:hypothetical protein
MEAIDFAYMRLLRRMNYSLPRWQMGNFEKSVNPAEPLGITPEPAVKLICRNPSSTIFSVISIRDFHNRLSAESLT